MTNPFTFDGPVTGESFVSRGAIISEVASNARANENTVIYGSRQGGKSSLLAEMARRTSREFIFVKMSARAASDESQFLDRLTREVIMAGVGKAWSVDPDIWALLGTKRTRAALSHGGDLAIEERIRANMPEAVAAKRADNGRSEPAEEKELTLVMCPRCGRPLKWIEAYKRHFCYSCKRYAPKQRKRARWNAEDWCTPNELHSCPDCESSMTYVHRYSEYYCGKCRGYPRIGRRVTHEPWGKEDMMAALDLPQKLSEVKGKPVVVMLDDVPGLDELGDGRLVEAMRLKFEEHEDATYVFTGNSGKAMKRMFEDRDGAFYKFARGMELGEIPSPEMQRFLISRFRSGGGRLSEYAAERIVGVSERIPSYAQQIGHELFQISTMPEAPDVEAAIQRTVTCHSGACSLLWDSIRSPLHRRYLYAVVQEPGVPHGRAFVRRYGLKSRSHVQRIERQLEARGIISKSEITDPMFVMWLRQLNSF